MKNMEKKDNNLNEENIEYLSSLSKRKGAKVIAWVCLVIIGILIVLTFITGITGSKYFAGCLFLCIIVPFLMYVFLWIGKVLFSSNKKDDKC